jgi:hypothetical protein
MTGGVDHPEIESGSDQFAVHKGEIARHAAHEWVKLLAAIPEASPPSHRSKRRAANADQANLEWAQKLKAACNLDASFDQGTTDPIANSILHFTKEHIVDNAESIGINLGNGELEVSKTVDKINSREISRIFYQGEKELAEEENVDKLILHSMCSEVMDQVMDCAYPSDYKTIPRKKSPRPSQKGKQSDKEINNTSAE